MAFSDFGKRNRKKERQLDQLVLIALSNFQQKQDGLFFDRPAVFYHYYEYVVVVIDDEAYLIKNNEICHHVYLTRR